MALAYTAPTWTDGSGEGISASNLQAISNNLEGIIQGNDKAIHAFTLNGQTLTVTYVDGSVDTFTASGLKGISSIAKTGTSGLVDTYTITFTDGTTATFTVTNGSPGATPVITVTATADATSSDTPTVTVTKSGTDTAPSFAMAFSGLKGVQGQTGQTGPAGADGTDGVSPEVTITTITGGHRVNITDAEHPTGQSFDVMDGTGAGDMTAAVYDPDGDVATAGGIPDYVEGLLPTVLSSTTYTDTSGTRTFTFSDAAITTTSRFDYYADVFGVVPTGVSVSSGSLQVNFNTSDNVTECAVEVK